MKKLFAILWVGLWASSALSQEFEFPKEITSFPGNITLGYSPAGDHKGLTLFFDLINKRMPEGINSRIPKGWIQFGEGVFVLTPNRQSLSFIDVKLLSLSIPLKNQSPVSVSCSVQILGEKSQNLLNEDEDKGLEDMGMRIFAGPYVRMMDDSKFKSGLGIEITLDDYQIYPFEFKKRGKGTSITYLSLCHDFQINMPTYDVKTEIRGSFPNENRKLMRASIQAGVRIKAPLYVRAKALFENAQTFEEDGQLGKSQVRKIFMLGFGTRLN